MSGAPRVKSINVANSESRLVLGPGGNKGGGLIARKSSTKPQRKTEEMVEKFKSAEDKKPQRSSKNATSPQPHSLSFPAMLRRHEQLLQSNFSLNASCSSDASTDSFHSRASTGRLPRSNSLGSRRKQYVTKPRSVVSDGGLVSPPGGSQSMKRCAWVTPNTDPCYVAFHDEEWGIPVHDDKLVTRGTPFFIGRIFFGGGRLVTRGTPFFIGRIFFGGGRLVTRGRDSYGGRRLFDGAIYLS